MTKDEFVLRRLKEDAGLYRILYPIYVGVLVVFLVLDALSFFMGKPSISFGGGIIILALALRTPSVLQMRDDAAKAAEEYQAYLAGSSHGQASFSEPTLRALRELQVTPKQLLVQWGASAVMALVLFAGFVALFVVAHGDLALTLLALLLLAMAIPFVFLGFRMYRAWRVSKQLEE